MHFLVNTDAETQKKNTGKDGPAAEIDHHDTPQIQDTKARISENTELPFNPDSSSQVSQICLQTDSDYQVTQPEQCYHIPPPPKQDYGSKFSSALQSKRIYEYARVPSSHATLPREINEDHREPVRKEYDDNDYKQQTMRNNSKVDIQQNVPCESKPCDETEKQSEVRTVNGLIVKNIPQQRSTPKFIPRQTLNIVKTQLKPSTEDGITQDPLRSELQRNAFLLGKKHGPETRGERRAEVSAEDKSMNNTVSQIRKRVQKVSVRVWYLHRPSELTGTLDMYDRKRRVYKSYYWVLYFDNFKKLNKFYNIYISNALTDILAN